jgi:hypothetical protein
MVSRSFQLQSISNRVDFFDSGLKNVQSISPVRGTDVRNTETITHNTIGTTTSSDMHESHAVAVLNNVQWLKNNR